MGCRYDGKPIRELLRCKIFAAGTASFPGIILGGRTLGAVSQGGMGLQVRDKSYYLALYDIELPRLEGPKQKMIDETMHAKIHPVLAQEHCGMRIVVGASAVDSDAEDEDGYAQEVAAQTGGAQNSRSGREHSR